MIFDKYLSKKLKTEELNTNCIALYFVLSKCYQRKYNKNKEHTTINFPRVKMMSVLNLTHPTIKKTVDKLIDLNMIELKSKSEINLLTSDFLEFSKIKIDELNILNN